MIDPKKTYEERMSAAFNCSVVNGRLYNLHSSADAVLSTVFTKIHSGQVPIGIQQILTDVPDDLFGKIGVKRATNVDVKKEVGGHLGYKDGCLEFFYKIPSAY